MSWNQNNNNKKNYLLINFYIVVNMAKFWNLYALRQGELKSGDLTINRETANILLSMILINL